ncbi:MAG: hypothetical protein DRJ38_01550 [Thermoprotei archaeon]|nr:MAG: hypothetical protein DRJ38_01550 [Thermoprotei archaeon]
MTRKSTILVLIAVCLIGIFSLVFLTFLGNLVMSYYMHKPTHREPLIVSDIEKPEMPVFMPSTEKTEEKSTAGEFEVQAQTLPYRKMVYEAYLRLKVEDSEEKAREAESIALKYNGYVGNLQIGKDRAVVTLRIPTENFYLAINDLRKLGELEDENVRAIDVTEEYIDLTARLNNLKNVEKRLLALLDKAVTVEEILKVEAQLKVVREEIERLTARLRYLENRIEYSTIVVEFIEPEKVEVEWPSFNILDAVAKGLAAMYAAVYALVVIVFALIPLIVLGGLIYIAYKTYKRRVLKAKPK